MQTMFLISEMINLINCYFKDKVFTEEQFHSAKYAGLVEPMPYQLNEDTTVTIPAEINSEGDSEIISFDDKYALQLYHKLNLKNNKLTKYQYGDTNKNVIDTYNLSMILICDRTIINSGQSKIDYLVSRLFPDAIRNPDKRIIAYIQPGNVDFNTKRIFNTEFQGIDYNSINHFMIQVDYQIISSQYKRQCIDLCGTLPNTKNTIT